MFQRAHQLLAIGFTIALSGSMANAAQSEVKQDTIKLIGSLDLHGANIRKIQSGERQGKNLLYLEDIAEHSITIVDVTNAVHPVVEKEVTVPNGFASVQAVAGEVALMAVHVPDSALERVESLSIVSLGDSDDRHRVTRTFTNVTALSTDDQRGLIYVVDQDGLKILSKNFSPDPQLESENAWRFAP